MQKRGGSALVPQLSLKGLKVSFIERKALEQRGRLPPELRPRFDLTESDSRELRVPFPIQELQEKRNPAEYNVGEIEQLRALHVKKKIK